MNYKFLKVVVFSISALLMLTLSGCLKKDAATYNDFSTLQDFVILTAGAGGSSSANVPFNRGADLTQTITADLASANDASGSITVTLAVDPAALSAYNAANGTSYVALPTGNYKLQSTTLTIPAGQHYAQTTMLLTNLGTLDPGTSYMVAVSITDASGKKLSGNLNTLYFYTIGNPLAGVYSWTAYRWNAPNLDTTTSPASVLQNNSSVSLSPLGPTTLFLPTGYLTQNGVTAGTALSFTNSGGTLSGLGVSFYDMNGSFASTGWSVVTGPVLVGSKIVGTAATKYVGSVFRIYYVFFNGSAQRATIDNFVKTQ